MSVDDETFDGWVREYTRPLFGIAYWWTGSRAEAEELTQEAFFQAYRSRGSLRDLAVAKSWLIGILRHCHAQTRRKNQPHAHISLDEMLHDLPGKESMPDEVLALHQSLARLEEHHRLPLILFYFEDVSYKDISVALDIPIGTVMSRLARGKQILHRALSQQNNLVVLPKREAR